MGISTAHVEAHERAKNEDFEYGFQSIIRNMAFLDRMLTSTSNDYVVGGSVSAVSGTMTIIIDKFWANGEALDLPALINDAVSDPIVITAPVNSPQYSIIQVRGILQGFDNQQRAFFDPETESVIYHNIDTKTRLNADIVIKYAQEGAAYAPTTDTGYVKIAEMYIEPGTVAITQDNIINVSAIHQGDENVGWTNEKTRTFKVVELIDFLKNLTYHKNKEVIDHPDSSVTTAKIKDTNITAAKLASNAVETAKIKDGAVTLTKIADAAKSAMVENKADKVSGAANGNLAGLNASGALTDSGKKPADFAPANASLAADTGTGTDTATGAVASKTVAEILQDIWAKIRQIVNVLNTRLPLSGGTMTGPLKFKPSASDGVILQADLPQYKGGLMRLKDANASGAALAIQPGGLMIVGGGESANTYLDNSGETADIERAIITSDEDIGFITKMQGGWAARRTGGVRTDGRIYMDSAGIPANLSSLEDNDLIPKKLATASPVIELTAAQLDDIATIANYGIKKMLRFSLRAQTWNGLPGVYATGNWFYDSATDEHTQSLFLYWVSGDGAMCEQYYRMRSSKTAWAAWKKAALDGHTHTIANITSLQTTLNAKAPAASPIFTGTPKIKDANNSENRIAVAAATTSQTETNLPVGCYILVNCHAIEAFNNANTTWQGDVVRLADNQYRCVPTGTVLSGTWRASGWIGTWNNHSGTSMSVSLWRRVA